MRTNPPRRRRRRDGRPRALATAGVLATLAAMAATGVIDLSTPASAQAAPVRCEGKKATIVGTNAADVIRGTDGDDVIVGLGGNDRIDGRGGRDVICGGPGRDRIDGGAGRDELYGGAGRDTLDTGGGRNDVADGQGGDDTIVLDSDGAAGLGGSGDDDITAMEETNLLSGQGGDDRLRGGPYGDTMAGGPGKDHLTGAGGTDLLYGDGGADRLDGGARRDEIHGGDGDDEISTGAGANDQAWGDDGNDAMTIAAPGGYGQGGPGNDVMSVSADSVLLAGGDGDDHLTGGATADHLDGEAGNDSIDGQGGDDTIAGGEGDDTLAGGDGNDTIDAGGGTDTCAGGSGTDTCDGGAPGTSANTPDDVDTCDAETMRSCRAQTRIGYSGSASGTVVGQLGGTATETFSATYALAPVGDATSARMWVGKATVQWSISGLDAAECTVSGAGTVVAGVVLLSHEPAGPYYEQTFDVDPDQRVAVTHVCPWGTEVLDEQPLYLGLETGLQPLGTDVLAGARTYHPDDTPDASASWQWRNAPVYGDR